MTALKERAKREGCDVTMLLPDGKTCRDCADFLGCLVFIGRTGKETHCDWAPSVFFPAAKAKPCT